MIYEPYFPSKYICNIFLTEFTGKREEFTVKEERLFEKERDARIQAAEAGQIESPYCNSAPTIVVSI